MTGIRSLWTSTQRSSPNLLSRTLIIHFHILIKHSSLVSYEKVIHEEFGDGIMSAIDFSVNVERERDPAGDRVKLTWSGKFLPYKQF